jgi:predicted transcriptional regulator
LPDVPRDGVTRIVDKLFHGSPEQLIAQLVEDESLSAEDLKRLRSLLSAQSKKDGGTKR